MAKYSSVDTNARSAACAARHPLKFRLLMCVGFLVLVGVPVANLRYHIWGQVHEWWFGVPPAYSCAAPLIEQQCNRSAGRRRIFDIALYSHESDHEMRTIRTSEIGGCVHAIIFVQTAFAFKDGAPKPTFPVARDPSYTGAARVSDFIVPLPNATLARCQRSHAFKDFKAIYKRMKTKFTKPSVSWCLQSYARNAMGEAFVAAGGRDDDLVLLSDADEIPRAEVLQQLQGCAPPPGVVLKLAAVHNFRYNVGCERAGSVHHFRGPALMLGSTLRAHGAPPPRTHPQPRRRLAEPTRPRAHPAVAGAQAVRTTEGCQRVGYHASCTYVPRLLVSRGSWHLSSFSGGPRGQARAPDRAAQRCAQDRLRACPRRRW